MAHHLRTWLTYLVMAAFLATPLAPLINKLFGGDGSYVQLYAVSMPSELLSSDLSVSDQTLAEAQSVFDDFDGDVIDLDNDEQTPQDDFFSGMTMVFTSSFSLEGDVPVATYNATLGFASLSHISSPLARPPRASV